VLAELPASNSIPVALLGNEAFVGRRREAAELAKVGALGADAGGDHVGVGDDRFNRHLEVWELCPQPCDHLRACEGPWTGPGSSRPNGSTACSRYSSAMMSPAALRFLVVKTSLNSRMTRALLSCDNPFPSCKEARYWDLRGLGSGDIDARDVKAQEAAEGCAEYERPQQYRQYRYENT
jgi:hypothetical protein